MYSGRDCGSDCSTSWSFLTFYVPYPNCITGHDVGLHPIFLVLFRDLQTPMKTVNQKIIVKVTRLVQSEPKS